MKLAHGHGARRVSANKDIDLTSTSSQEESSQERLSCQSPPPHRGSSRGMAAASSGWRSSSLDRRGATSNASFSVVPRAVGRHPSSTTRSATPTYTLWQASHLFGSTATKRNVFSSLMTLRSALARKCSADSWTAILSVFRGREDLFWLDTIASSCAQTIGTTSRDSLPTWGAASRQVASSGSAAREATTSHYETSCSEEESDPEDSIDLTAESEGSSQDSSSTRKRSRTQLELLSSSEAE